MGRTAIEEKLTHHLSSKGPLTESRVVYILVETRKLLELQDELDRYSTLRFFCDWALHTELSRAGAQRILRLFDEAYPLICSNQVLPPNLEREIADTTNLKQFKDEFAEVLAAYGLPNTIVTNRWPTFLQSYTAVIEDCPLTVAGTKLHNIKSVTLHKINARPGRRKKHRAWPMCLLRWICFAKDATTGSWEVQTTIP
jgi:hypothetical protein